MNHRYTARQGISRVSKVNALARKKNLALIRGNDASQDAHQRGLSGAVVTNDRVHRAPAHVQVDLVQRCGRTEGLRHTSHFNDWRCVGQLSHSFGWTSR